MKIKNVIEKETGTGEITLEYAKKIFEELLAFQGYGFCKCLGVDTIVETLNGSKKISDLVCGEYVKAPDKDFNNIYVKVNNIWRKKEELYEVELENGRKIKSSLEHKFLCDDKKMHPLKEIIENQLSIITGD